MDINLLKAHLGDELFTQVQEKLGSLDGFAVIPTNDGSWLPKSRLDDEITKRNGLKETIKTLTQQLQEANDKVKSSGTLQAQVDQLTKDLAARDATIGAMQRSGKIRDELIKANAKNPELVEKLLDGDKIKTDDKGGLTGLSEQIEALKKDSAYLFADGKPADRGGFYGGGKDTNTNKTNVNDAVNQALRAAFGRS